LSQELQPLSNELIIAALDGRDFAYKIDDDGDVLGNWQGTLIYFFRIGEQRELLQVRVLTQRTFSTDDVPRLYSFCNHWNHDKLFPKAYVHVADDGAARVVGEVVADWEHGVTLKQLDQVMLCGIATGCQLADAVSEL
jgi:Putative bacterial sensory transduction regulator